MLHANRWLTALSILLTAAAGASAQAVDERPAPGVPLYPPTQQDHDLDHCAIAPPSMSSSLPVVYAESSDAK